MKKCQNCKGIGIVTGTRDRDLKKGREVIRSSKCLYCQGEGYRK